MSSSTLTRFCCPLGWVAWRPRSYRGSTGSRASAPDQAVAERPHLAPERAQTPSPGGVQLAHSGPAVGSAPALSTSHMLPVVALPEVALLVVALPVVVPAVVPPVVPLPAASPTLRPGLAGRSYRLDMTGR